MTNSNDPSGFLNPPNQVVKIINTAREDLNGKLAAVVSFSEARNRYTIAIPPSNPTPSSPQSQQPSALSLKPSNLQVASMMEKIKFRSIEARQQVQMLYDDPRLRNQFQTVYNNFQSKLPVGVKPEHVGYGTILVSLLIIYLFGFSKTILAYSILIMILVVSAPDLFSGNANLRTVARNFPSRWRSSIVEITGFTRISNRAAMVIFVVLIIMCTKVLITPNVAPAVKASSFSSNTPSDIARSSTTNTATYQSKIDEIYKLGFDDAKAEKQYGHSLPSAEEISLNTNAVGSSFDDDLNWENDPNWTPPSPPNSGGTSKFGFSTMMAIFTIFRTVKDLGVGPNGSFNMQLLIANAKRLEPLRLGLLGLSVYRLVSVFVF